ncbi:hypothetical protein [Helicobacter pylori]|uniref:hypothetical protein n=1 Tax=Helicobacter pylori TaxID=210 RepID=UPI0011287144|nr:hypothetical protein [Helicobacter pylori]TPH36631.1 hypothetical protein FIM79_07035 [Helicobacter pylori]
MQLFEKWQSVTDTYKSFYEETEHLGLEVSIFLKHFCEAIPLVMRFLNHPSRNPKISLVFRFKKGF